MRGAAQPPCGSVRGRTDRHSFALRQTHASCISLLKQDGGGMDGEKADVRGLCSFATALRDRHDCVVYAAGMARGVPPCIALRTGSVESMAHWPP